MSLAFRITLLHIAFLQNSPMRMLIYLAIITSATSENRAYETSSHLASAQGEYEIRTPRRASRDDLLHLIPSISSFDQNRYQWYLNNVAIAGATNLFYVTPPLREEHLGAARGSSLGRSRKAD